MKIVHCLNQYLPDHIAGTEIYTHTLATLQKAEGHEVSIVTPLYQNSASAQEYVHYIYDNIDVYQYVEPTIHKGYIFIEKKVPEGLKNFEKVIQYLKPDIIHFQELGRGIALTNWHLILAKSNAKVVLTMHLPGYTCSSNTLIRSGDLCNGKVSEVICSVCYLKNKHNLLPAISHASVATGLLFDKLGILRKIPAGKLKTLLSTPIMIRRVDEEIKDYINYTDQIVVLTEWYKQVLINNNIPENKISVVPQALATIGAKQVEKQHLPPVLPVRVAFIGRIQPQKGVHLLLEACKDLSPGQLVVDIYGKEEDTAYYKMCREKSLEIPSIRWMGSISRELVIDTLAGYHILCLPSSFSEMSPLVIQEAFAAGIPVLASKVYGNIEHVKDNVNGLLFDFNSSRNLREQLQALINDPPLIERLRSNVLMPRSFDTVLKAYDTIYTKIINEDNGPDKPIAKVKELLV